MDNFKVVARWHERPLGTPAEIENLAAHRRRIDDQTRHIAALVAEANTNLLRQARAKAADYLQAATEQRASERSIGNTNSLGATVKTNSVLIPEITAQWLKYLEKTEKETNSVLSVWHEWLACAAASRAPWEKFSQTTVHRPGASALLRDDPPRSIEELAQRYHEAFAKAEEAWWQLKSSTNGATADLLPDPVSESFRIVLYDPKGPFELPRNIEKYYPTDRTADLKREREALKTLEQSLPALPEAMALADGVVQNLRVHKRGSHLALGDETTRGFLKSIGAPEPPALGTNVSGRLQLAEWMTRPEHPLPARVMVNRIWHWHFGEGLVRTPDNFGTLGEKPTHPKLLDWLAHRFIESGWSIKAMHRLIMNSAVYQQASVAADVSRLTSIDEAGEKVRKWESGTGSPSASGPVSPAHFPTFSPAREQKSLLTSAAASDPENRLLSRFPRRRLEVEAIRDSILFVSGALDLSMGGSLLTVTNRAYVTSTASKLDPSLFDQPRRSLYLPVVRSALYDVFQVFDFADPSALNGHRDQTTVAPQALFMLNSKLVADAARRLAAQLLAEKTLDDNGRVKKLYRIAYNRTPNESEGVAALKYLRSYAEETERRGTKAEDSRVNAWGSFARSIVAANEFIYVD